MARCATTSRTAGTMRPILRSRTPRGVPMRTNSSSGCRTGMRRRSANAESSSRVVSSNAWRSRVRSSRPQILILDEATSNLDTESEQLIQAAMAGLLADRTTFVIAHRLSTIHRADSILLMEEGRVIERGTHDDLMRARGVYYEMVKRQMEAHARDGDEILR